MMGKNNDSKSATPLFTIITVTYNAGAYLEETIESIINQNYGNYEFLIIDGHSTDNTMNIVKRYEKNINFFISEPDKGIYDAMNKGIAYAKGKYINFMNAGDCFFDQMTLTKMAKEIENSSNIDILYGKFVLKNSDNPPLKFYKGKKISKWDLHTGIPICHQSMFIRRSLFYKIGFYSLDYQIISEYDWLIDYVNQVKSLKKLQFINEPVNEYLLDEGNSHIYALKGLKEFFQIAQKRFKIQYSLWVYFIYPIKYLKIYLVTKMVQMRYMDKYRTMKYKFLGRTVESL